MAGKSTIIYTIAISCSKLQHDAADRGGVSRGSLSDLSCEAVGSFYTNLSGWNLPDDYPHFVFSAASLLAFQVLGCGSHYRAFP